MAHKHTCIVITKSTTSDRLAGYWGIPMQSKKDVFNKNALDHRLRKKKTFFPKCIQQTSLHVKEGTTRQSIVWLLFHPSQLLAGQGSQIPFSKLLKGKISSPPSEPA
jgi:hypothetical protein